MMNQDDVVLCGVLDSCRVYKVQADLEYVVPHREP
jgi:hypothetical protein